MKQRLIMSLCMLPHQYARMDGNEPTTTNTGNTEQWQEQVNQLKTETAALALSLKELQDKLTEALTGNASKAELETIRTELQQTREQLQAAQTELTTLKRMEEQFRQRNGDGTPPDATATNANSGEPTPKQKRKWI